jgi:hypothetical protein
VNIVQFLLTALTRRLVECVGPVFLGFWQVEPGISHDALALQEEEESEDELTSSFIDPDDVNFLRSLDPKEWKVSNCFLTHFCCGIL